MVSKSDHTNWIENLIYEFVNNTPENSLRFNNDEKAWGNPIVGFSRGDDAYYNYFKEDIGEFHLTPYEFFTKTYPDKDITPEELSVICWILPQTKQTKLEHANNKDFPSERWVRARIYGNEINQKLARFLIAELENEGYSSMSPMISPFYELKRSKQYGYASTWSERHASFISGLGTFGLCDGLITEVGKAIRCGSIIANIETKITVRKYNEINEYCLYYSNGKCMKCADRCPAKAISINGHNKFKCSAYQNKRIADYTKINYNIESTCCGLCQVGVPCESSIPITNRGIAHTAREMKLSE